MRPAKELVDHGADPRYTVSPDLQLGYSSLVVQIEGVGSTPEAAVHTAELVGAALTRELERVQASQGVDPHYMIKTQQVVPPDSPTQQVSSTLRPLVGVLAIGAILLLLAVSAAEALETLRAEWGERDLAKGGARRGSIDGAPTNNGRHDGKKPLGGTWSVMRSRVSPRTARGEAKRRSTPAGERQQA